jgi:hypothetical protein
MGRTKQSTQITVKDVRQKSKTNSLKSQPVNYDSETDSHLDIEELPKKRLLNEDYNRKVSKQEIERVERKNTYLINYVIVHYQKKKQFDRSHEFINDLEIFRKNLKNNRILLSYKLYEQWIKINYDIVLKLEQK